MVTLTIDGKEIGAQEGETILEAANRVGIEIPTLCYHEAITPYGACRLCTVEVTQGTRTRLVASCLFPVEEGLVVKTDSARVRKLRQGIMELLLARCPDSEKIQGLAREMGVTKARFELEDSKCILCGLCVRACREVSEKSILSFAGRGTKRKVATPFYQPSEDCLTCRACAYICPTGAITLEDNENIRKVHTPYVTMEFKLKKCEVCGNYFAPEKQLDYIAKLAGLPPETFDKCPTCRD